MLITERFCMLWSGAYALYFFIMAGMVWGSVTVNRQLGRFDDDVLARAQCPRLFYDRVFTM
jgi:hypothetical protein